jgi:ABC-2 type transport system ATP-binding protein
MVDDVIQTESLTKFYGAHRGVIEVDLAVRQGEVFGFLGPNGAGKTTTIRILLDHIRPTSGRATVFGIETTDDPVAIHRRVGYLPGEFTLYDRLTGAQTIEYFANLRGGVDADYQQSLISRLDLDPSRRYREYSRGNKQKVALVCALQHRPDLLILDEPTAGLDPLVQQTFFALLHEATGEGRTVFLSSHIISEVERVCDRVAIIRDGRIVEVDEVRGLRRLAVHHVELRFAQPVATAVFESLPGVSEVVAEDEGRLVRLQASGSIGPVVQAATRHDLVDLTSREPNLEDVFLAHYGHD